MNTRYDPRADKIAVAITEAIIASQRDDEHPSLFTQTDTTLEALAVVAARIAFETKIADTAAKGARVAEQHAEMVGQTLKALRKSGDQHSFARVRGASPMAEAARGLDGIGGQAARCFKLDRSQLGDLVQMASEGNQDWHAIASSATTTTISSVEQFLPRRPRASDLARNACSDDGRQQPKKQKPK